MPRPSASETASRFAAHWVADALAADDALDFSSLMALLDATPESLTGAPASVSERVALRCLQELSAAASTGDGPTASRAPAGVLRVDITRSCEDLLLQIIGKVGTSGNLRKDMLPDFSQDIQNIICIKKPRLPETCFELLREVDPEIACTALPSPLEQNGDNTHDRLNIEEPRLPTDNAIHLVEDLTNLADQTYKENIMKELSEPTSDLQQPCISDTIIPRVDSNKTHPSSPQNDRGEKANQDLEYEGTSIQPVEKDSVHEKLAPRAGSVLPSVSCNDAIQGDKSETNHLLGKSKEHAALYEQPNDGNCHLKVCCGDKVNQSICSVTLHNRISEGNYLSEQNNAKRTTDVQKLSCSIPAPIPPRDGDGRRAKQISNKETLANTLVETSHAHSSDDSLSGSADEMSFCIKDQGTNSSPLGCSEKDLCIKCGKYGQLLKCSSCLLAAHKSCFGPAVTFVDSGKFCCPVCFYTKATEAYQEAKKTYCEARKNLAAFLGSQQLINQHDEQLPEVLPRASPSKGHLNGCNFLVKRKNSQQIDMHRLAYSDEKADQHRKKQKTNATVDACHEKAVTGKAPSAAQKEQEVKITETREESGNENSCDGMRITSHEKCGPSATNQECMADKEDSLKICNQGDGETEAISSKIDMHRLACSDEKADQHRKKQKTNATVDACHEKAVTGKAPSDAHKEQEVEITATREESGNESSCDGMRSTSHEKCGPSATNQERKADKEDSLKNCNQGDGETEAISSKIDMHRLACSDEKADQRRKKQKTNATVDGCHEKAVTGKAPSDAQKEEEVEITETREESGNKNSCDGMRITSHEKCGPSATNQVRKADKEDSLKNCNQGDGETEAISSNDSGQRSLLPLRNSRHREARLQERETPVSCNSGKATVQQGQHMPSPSRKRKYAYPINHRSDMVAPTGRRSKLSWTDEEVAALREAMEKFNPRDNRPVPWVQILEYGRDVFHRARLPCDLRVKWRNMMKKTGS
ncbi:uncharacterized protein [Lolium perenne]|uniref:uncharacterized protein n=1 Tax=Lolium perenne TaxID=4522 RepID=UPI0021F6092A|nr:uncharacterized protein LOC127321972 isoform X1 [Lolium perenne]XP_051206881.1 uncharacterized protein LOC127321972 isoform X1 [Lolium perenne]